MRRFYIAVSLTTICMLGLSAASQADAWGTSLWTDDFEDGNYSANPAWTAFGTPGTSQTVTTWEGDYALRLTAPYLGAPAGFSLAYVNNAIGDQRMLVWVDTSAVASDDAATVCVLRYTPPGLGFGTGYAVALLHTAGDAIAAQLYQIDDTANPAITDPVPVSATYTDVWVRAVAMGTNPDTRVLARVWPAGQPEPSTWMLDSDSPGSEAGITNHYDTGSGGVGTVALAGGVTADAYFDDLDFVQVTLSAEPRW